MTYKYQSDGTVFIAGVPARDLTDAEFKVLTKEQQDECILSGLYVAPADPPKTAKHAVAVTNNQEADNG